ncbi:MAG: hypothetical protein AAB354_10975, partial [candidate division KSB1 bacterium]
MAWTSFLLLLKLSFSGNPFKRWHRCLEQKKIPTACQDEGVRHVSERDRYLQLRIPTLVQKLLRRVIIFFQVGFFIAL